MLHIQILLTARCTVCIIFENGPPWTSFKVFHQMIIATTKYICIQEKTEPILAHINPVGLSGFICKILQKFF